MDKLIFIENEYHAREYLKNKEAFREFMPITFTFKAEQLLYQNNIEFKLEEEYEKNNIYMGIHNSSVKSSHEIIKRFKLKYKDVDLMSLFFYELYILFSSSKKNLILFKEIIKKEKPKEIAVFESKESLFEREFGATIIRSLFKGKLIKIKYVLPKKDKLNKRILIYFFENLQQKITNIILKFIKKKEKAFVMGGEQYFKKVLESLKEKKTIVGFGHGSGKSFFISKTFVPYYKFKGIKTLDNEEFKGKIKLFMKNISERELLKIKSIEKEIVNRIKFYLKDLIWNKFVDSSKKIDEAIQLLKEQNIKLFLFTADTDAPNIIIARIAKKFGSDTFGFQHGIFPEVFDEIGKNSESDYIFVYGKQTKKKFMDAGYEEKKIKVVGNPQYDSFVKTKNKNTKNILYAMEISSGNDALTPETQLTKKKQKILLRMIFNVLKKFPHYKLIIKTRTKWDMEGLPLAIAKEKNFKNFEIIEKTNNNKLINNCDLCLINQTTMGLEVLLLDKPLISVNLKEYDKTNPYKNISNVEIVYKEKQLEEAIKKNIYTIKNADLKDKNSLKKIILVDKKASKRVIKIISQTLKKRN